MIVLYLEELLPVPQDFRLLAVHSDRKLDRIVQVAHSLVEK